MCFNLKQKDNALPSSVIIGTLVPNRAPFFCNDNGLPSGETVPPVCRNG